MAMRSQSFYSAMSKYYGAVGKKKFVVKPDYPDFIDGKDCVKKMETARWHRFKKEEELNKKIDKIITVLLIVNFLLFIAFAPQAYYAYFLVPHCLIIGFGILNRTILKDLREDKIRRAFSFRCVEVE